MNLMSSDAQVFVSVIIPTYHDWQRLNKCIAGLQKQTYPSDSFEVIIVNNDPDEKQPSLSLPDNFFILTESTPGSYAARNKGAEFARGEVLAFADSDCIPEPQWLEAATKALQQGADRVAGKIKLFFASDKLTPAEVYEKAFAFQQEKAVQQNRTSVTANLVIRKDVFKHVGGFDSNLFSGGDAEWGWRATEMGYNLVYSCDAVVLHPARNKIRQILQKKKRQIGGGINIRRCQNDMGYLWFPRGLLPPKNLKAIFSNNDLKFSEKVTVYGLLYFFKVYQTIYRSLLMCGIVQPKRT